MMPPLTIDEAARSVGVSRRTIYHWLQQGRLDYFKTAGGRIMVRQESLWRTKEGRPWEGPVPTRAMNSTTTFHFPGRTLL